MLRQEAEKRRARAAKALQRAKAPLTTLNGRRAEAIQGKKIQGRKMNFIDSYFFAPDFFAFGSSSFQRGERDFLQVDIHPGNRAQVDMS
jgi:hypothetical protein